MLGMIEVGTYGIFALILVAGFLCISGFNHMPDQAKKVAVAAVMMFVGYQLFEFLGGSFIVVAR